MLKRMIPSLALLVLLLAACSPPPSVDATASGMVHISVAAATTAVPGIVPTATQTATLAPPTAAPTATETAAPQPRAQASPRATREPVTTVDLSRLEMPYLQDGGAIPPGALARIGIGNVQAVVTARTSGQMWLATDTGVYVYDAPRLRRIWRNYLSESPLSLSLSGDETRLVVGFDWGGSPLLLEATSGNRLAELEGWGDVAWTSDGQYVAVEAWPEMGNDENPAVGGVILYNARTGGHLKTLETEIDEFYGPAFFDIAWSEDKRQIAACDETHLFVWDVWAGALQTVASFPEDGYGCFVSFSPDGGVVVVDQGRLIIDALTGDILQAGAGGTLSYPAGDGMVFCRDQEHRLERVNITDWTVEESLPSNVEDCVLSTDGREIAALTRHGLIIADASTLEVRLESDGLFQKYPSAARWSPGGRWLAVSTPVAGTSLTGGETYHIIDMATGEAVLGILEGRIDALTGFIDAATFFVVSGNQLIFIDVTSGEVVGGARLNLEVERLGWTEDGQLILMGGKEDGAWRWSRVGGVTHLNAAPVRIASEVALPDNVPFLKPEETLTLSLDGSLQALSENQAGCGGGPYGGGCGIFESTLRINETETGALFVEQRGVGGTALAWSPDNQWLAVGRGSYGGKLSDYRIVISDPFENSEAYMLEGHLGYISGLVYSPDGSMLASASEDGTIIVWRVP